MDSKGETTQRKDSELTEEDWVHECYVVSPAKNGPFGPLVERILKAGRAQGRAEHETGIKQARCECFEDGLEQGRYVECPECEGGAIKKAGAQVSCSVCYDPARNYGTGRITREHAERLRVVELCREKAAHHRQLADDTPAALSTKHVALGDAYANLAVEIAAMRDRGPAND